MSLISLEFGAFLLCLLLLYYIVPLKWRWTVLLAGSWWFYLSNAPELSVFLLITILTAYYSGRRLGRINEETEAGLRTEKESWDREQRRQYRQRQTRRKKQVLLAAVLWNMGVLCVLKYTGFIFGSLNRLLAAAGAGAALPEVSFLLPLGISFYTFQAVGYVIDVYRGKYGPDTSLPRFMLFVSFFPQIIQGPISRHDQLAHQLYEGHTFDYDRLARGAQLFLWGLMKKLILAERLALAADTVFIKWRETEGLTVLIGAACYGLQVYGDFSGGMDMVRGIGEMFGIEMTENFARPYFAKSLEEFWRRWHITLGAWMRDYVFYPVSLSKWAGRLGKKTKKWFGVRTGKMIPTFFAMFLTFFLVGIWHGAEWKFVAYGLWNGIIISGSILMQPLYGRLAERFSIRRESRGWGVFCMVRTFFLCTLGRYFSRGLSLGIAVTMLKHTFTVWNPWILIDGTLLELGLSGWDWLVVFAMLALLWRVGILKERGASIRARIGEMKLPVRWGIYMAAVLAVAVLGVYGPEYSAAQFVYQQF